MGHITRENSLSTETIFYRDLLASILGIVAILFQASVTTKTGATPYLQVFSRTHRVGGNAEQT